MEFLRVIILFFTLTGCHTKSSEDYRKLANKLEREGRYTEAITMLDKAVEKDSSNIKAILDRAVDKSLIEDYKGAIDDYSKVLKLDANNTLALLNRGKNSKRLENYIAAITDFNNAALSKGGETLYLDRLENPFVETGFEYDVQMEEIRFERALAYYSIDSFQKAFNDFSFCIQKNYMPEDCYYFRGFIYLKHRKKEEGCADLRKATKLGNFEAGHMLQKNCD